MFICVFVKISPLFENKYNKKNNNVNYNDDRNTQSSKIINYNCNIYYL